MSMQYIAVSGLLCAPVLGDCGRIGIDSSNNLWWLGNWWRFNRQLFRTPLPAAGVPEI
jgi:hypothetical protein